MHKQSLHFLFYLLWFSLPGCGLLTETAPPQDNIGLNSHQINLADSRSVSAKIYSQHHTWQGTKYVMGGLSKRGIDCSGLVYATYREQLGIALPRTTKSQINVGIPIQRSKLRAGDLVFFKTGIKVRHVGIYIEKGKFFHASTKKGVMISNLNDYYWKDKYWHARRVQQ